MEYQHITVWYIRIPGTLFTQEEAATTTESTPAPQDFFRKRTVQLHVLRSMKGYNQFFFKQANIATTLQ